MKVIRLICNCLYAPLSGEFGVVYHGIYTPDINKVPQAVAVKTLKGWCQYHLKYYIGTYHREQY